MTLLIRDIKQLPPKNPGPGGYEYKTYATDDQGRNWTVDTWERNDRTSRTYVFTDYINSVYSEEVSRDGQTHAKGEPVELPQNQVGESLMSLHRQYVRDNRKFIL